VRNSKSASGQRLDQPPLRGQKLDSIAQEVRIQSVGLVPSRSQPTRSKQGVMTMPFALGGGFDIADLYPLLTGVVVRSALRLTPVHDLQAVWVGGLAQHRGGSGGIPVRSAAWTQLRSRTRTSIA